MAALLLSLLVILGSSTPGSGLPQSISTQNTVRSGSVASPRPAFAFPLLSKGTNARLLRLHHHLVFSL